MAVFKTIELEHLLHICLLSRGLKRDYDGLASLASELDKSGFRIELRYLKALAKDIREAKLDGKATIGRSPTYIDALLRDAGYESLERFHNTYMLSLESLNPESFALSDFSVQEPIVFYPCDFNNSIGPILMGFNELEEAKTTLRQHETKSIEEKITQCQAYLKDYPILIWVLNKNDEKEFRASADLQQLKDLVANGRIILIWIDPENISHRFSVGTGFSSILSGISDLLIALYSTREILLNLPTTHKANQPNSSSPKSYVNHLENNGTSIITENFKMEGKNIALGDLIQHNHGKNED